MSVTGKTWHQTLWIGRAFLLPIILGEDLPKGTALFLASELTRRIRSKEFVETGVQVGVIRHDGFRKTFLTGAPIRVELYF